MVDPPQTQYARDTCRFDGARESEEIRDKAAARKSSSRSQVEFPVLELADSKSSMFELCQRGTNYLVTEDFLCM